MFLIDGISYLFSACTEVFLEIPKIERKGVKVTFREDFREGLRFIWKHQGVVRIIGMSFLINYLFGVIRVLIIPWFAGEEKLGMARYGILNGVQSVGLVAGMAVLTVITIRTEQKYRVYLVTLLLFAASIGAGVFLNQYAAILISFFLAFGFQFVFNTVMNATLMAQTPVGYRGKVSATKTTLGMAISPLGNFAGGVLCVYADPRMLIVVHCAAAMIIAAALVVHPTVKGFFLQETEKRARSAAAEKD